MDRIITITYESELDQSIEEMEEHDEGWERIVPTLLISISTIGVFIYTIFVYPRLFLILVIGQAIDFVGENIKEKLRKKN